MSTLVRGGLQGLGAFVAVAVTLIYSHGRGRTEVEIRSLTFATLIAVTIALTFANRSTTEPFWKTSSRNPALYGLTLAAMSMLALIFYIPRASALFHVSSPSARDLIWIGAAAILALGWMEIAKWIARPATRLA